MSEFDHDPIDDDAVPDHDDPVIQYVDGGMDAAARIAFEARLATSPELQKEVRTARIVRGLVAGLPRAKSAMPPVEALLERMDAEPSRELGRLLRALPRAAAPESLRDRVFRNIRTLSPQRLRAMPPRIWFRVAAAAVVLVACGVAFDAGRPARPAKGPFRFSIEIPQRTLPGFNASALPRFPASVGSGGSRGDRR
ncbi:MAG: hypothetical protein JNL94_06990 [Planctomycetes bacterium]|nr:hypothetical protein [Planctomycetota bacterium]